jgi:hypothetical protein
MREHIALKKVLGNSDRGLGPARCAGLDRGLRPTLVGGQRDRRRAVRRVARGDLQQVLFLAGALRPRQRDNGSVRRTSGWRTGKSRPSSGFI